jgi:hypothetical protein
MGNVVGTTTPFSVHFPLKVQRVHSGVQLPFKHAKPSRGGGEYWV